MRTAALAVIALGVYGLSACKDTESAMDRGLNEDLALAASNDGFNLISSNETRGTVSPLEQTARSAARPASSQRARVSSPVANPTPVQLAVKTEPAPEMILTTASEPEPQSEPTIIESPPAPVSAPRPQPVPVEAPAPSTAGSNGGGDIAVGIGRVIGVVIRGGVVNGDHCDPRTDRRRGGHIAINNRIPTPRTF